MKITKSQLREIIKEEIQKLSESATKGDVVSFIQQIDGGDMKWYIRYIDSTHVHLSTKPDSTSSFSTYHIRELKDNPYYGDMVKWMESGNKKHIDGKKYKG